MKRSRREIFQDIIEFSILPRLPAKSLVRLKCVSKGWYSLISDNHFFILQQYQACTSPSIPISQLDGDSGSITRDLPPQFKGFEIDVMTLCNGLIVMLCSQGMQYEVYVGNPVLQDWKMIPKPAKFLISNIRLAFDPVVSAARYELVFPYSVKGAGLPCYIPSNSEEYGFMVFSTETGEWKVSKSKIILPFPSCSMRKTVFLKGIMYWKLEVHVCGLMLTETAAVSY